MAAILSFSPATTLATPRHTSRWRSASKHPHARYGVVVGGKHEMLTPPKNADLENLLYSKVDEIKVSLLELNWGQTGRVGSWLAVYCRFVFVLQFH